MGDTLVSYGLSGIEIIGQEHNSLLAIYQPIVAANLPELPGEMLRGALAGAGGQVVIQEVATG